MKLHPVTYNFDWVSFSKFIGAKQAPDYVGTLTELSKIRQTGFIAQEVDAAVNASGYAGFDAVSKPASDKETYGLAYSTLVVPLVKAVQEQQEQIAQQQKQIDEQQKQIEELKKLIKKN